MRDISGWCFWSVRAIFVCALFALLCSSISIPTPSTHQPPTPATVVEENPQLGSNVLEKNAHRNIPDETNGHDHTLKIEWAQPTNYETGGRIGKERFTRSASSLNRSQNVTDCGDRLCHCNNGKANCSGHPDGIPYVPRLPNDTYDLNLSRNNIRNITDDFFINVTGIIKLTLDKNDIQYISRDSFKVFRGLKNVFIDRNARPMQYSMLLPVVNTSSIQVLNLIRAGLGPLPPGFLNNLPKLKKLGVKQNSLGDIALSMFKKNHHLTNLDLSDNKMSHFTVDTVMPSLSYIRISDNGLLFFPQTCINNSWQSFLPNLNVLNIARNLIRTIPELVCLPKLTHLDLTLNIFSVIPANTFGSARFPSLQILIVQRMNMNWQKLSAYAFNNTSLKYVDIEHNSLRFYDSAVVDADFLAHCPNISDLRLSGNFMAGVSNDRFLQLFGHLDQMKSLFIGSCQMSEFNRERLSPFRKIEFLSMNDNYFVQLADGTFDDLPKLTMLQINNNQIAVVSPNLFSPTTRQRLQNLDLSGNRFDCSCSVLWFQAWLISQPSLFEPAFKTYECFNIPGLLVVDFVMNPQACMLSHTAYVIIAVVFGLVIAAYTSFLLAYRYRWHFRLILFEAFRGTGDARRRHLARNDFDFDIFVCYESEDLPWVKQHLMPQMEDRMGLKLCVHQRDFIVGKYISENISDCVDKSKKVMMLFSTNFAESQWCQFELALCLRHVMDHDDDLIIVCLDDVSSRDITGTMMAVMKTTTYIQWEENNEDAVRAFWGRLNIALQEIIPRAAV